MAALAKKVFGVLIFALMYVGIKRRKGTNIARFRINQLHNTAQNCLFCLTNDRFLLKFVNS